MQKQKNVEKNSSKIKKKYIGIIILKFLKAYIILQFKWPNAQFSYRPIYHMHIIIRNKTSSYN